MYKIVFQYETPYTVVLYTAYSLDSNYVDVSRLWNRKHTDGTVELTETKTLKVGIIQVTKTKFVWSYEYKMSSKDGDLPWSIEMGISKSWDTALEDAIQHYWSGDLFHNPEKGWRKVEIE